MIEYEEMRQLLCRTYGGLRERVVATADDWIGDGGEFIAHVWMSQLCDLVQQRFAIGDYEQSEALFELVEKLLLTGADAVKNVVATSLLEGLQHQRNLAPNLWKPLLGTMARSHCAAMDNFNGVTE